MENNSGDLKKGLEGVFDENVEQQREAEKMIEQLAAKYGDDGLDRSARHLAKTSKKRFHLRVLGIIICIAVSLFVVANYGSRFLALKGDCQAQQPDECNHYICDFSGGDPVGSDSWAGKEVAKDLSRDEILIMFGDRSQPTEELRYKALWDLDPSNPAYYIEYAMGYAEDRDSLPLDFIFQGEKIDQGNGWYALMAAAFEAEGSVEKVRSPAGKRKGVTANAGQKQKPKPGYKVTDEDKFATALQLMYQAAEAGSLVSHQRELVAKRMKLLPRQGIDYISQAANIAYMGSLKSYALKSLVLSKVVRLEAERCGAQRDGERLNKLIGAWEVLGQRMIRGDGFSIVDALVARAWIVGPLEDFRDAANACGMSDRALEFERLQKVFEDDMEAKKNRPSRIADYKHKLGAMHVILMPPFVGKQVISPPELKPEDFMPGRIAEHALAGKVLVSAASLLMALLVGVLLISRLRYRAAVRRVAIALRSQLGGLDWVWLVLGGVIFPVGLYLVVNLLSPWSARHHGIHQFGYPVVAQFACMVLLVGVMVPLLARWRWRKQAGYLGFSTGWVQWVPAVLLCIAMPLSGVGDALYEHARGAILSSAVLIGFALFWILICFLRLVFGGRNRAVSRLLLTHTLMPVFSLTALLWALMAPVYDHEEKKWIAQEPDLINPLGFNSDEPGGDEFRIAEQLKREVSDLMGWQ